MEPSKSQGKRRSSRLAAVAQSATSTRDNAASSNHEQYRSRTISAELSRHSTESSVSPTERSAMEKSVCATAGAKCRPDIKKVSPAIAKPKMKKSIEHKNKDSFPHGSAFACIEKLLHTIPGVSIPPVGKPQSKDIAFPCKFEIRPKKGQALLSRKSSIPRFEDGSLDIDEIQVCPPEHLHSAQTTTKSSGSVAKELSGQDDISKDTQLTFPQNLATQDGLDTEIDDHLRMQRIDGKNQYVTQRYKGEIDDILSFVNDNFDACFSSGPSIDKNPSLKKE